MLIEKRHNVSSLLVTHFSVSCDYLEAAILIGTVAARADELRVGVGGVADAKRERRKRLSRRQMNLNN